MATATVTERRPLMDLPTIDKYLGVRGRHIRRLVQERRIPFIQWVICCARPRRDRRLGRHQGVPCQPGPR